MALDVPVRVMRDKFSNELNYPRMQRNRCELWGCLWGRAGGWSTSPRTRSSRCAGCGCCSGRDWWDCAVRRRWTDRCAPTECFAVTILGVAIDRGKRTPRCALSHYHRGTTYECTCSAGMRPSSGAGCDSYEQIQKTTATTTTITHRLLNCYNLVLKRKEMNK